MIKLNYSKAAQGHHYQFGIGFLLIKVTARIPVYNQIESNSKTINRTSKHYSNSLFIRTQIIEKSPMKATTTITTSSYYGNTIKTPNQNLPNSFISPQQMLKRLIPYSEAQKNKQNQQPINQQTQHQISSQKSLIADVDHLQSELNNIHAEVIESQNLLNVRESLYGQLDMLRDEREQIESDICYFEDQCSSNKQVRVSVRANHGYKQMNERLRRRMHEVREYIHKMQLQNKKIAQNINHANMLSIQKNYRTQHNVNSNWVDNAYYAQRQRSTGRVDEMIARLHAKQDEALERVKRQEDEIKRRNQMNRGSFGVNPTMASQMGVPMVARSFYGPSVNTSGGRRFYSPDYRY